MNAVIEIKQYTEEERKEMLEAFLRQEQIFENEHKQDSDDALITYVQQCAQQLGHCPKKREVVGYTYLKVRLGPWHRILERAGLKDKSARQLEKEERKHRKAIRQEHRRSK